MELGQLPDGRDELADDLEAWGMSDLAAEAKERGRKQETGSMPVFIHHAAVFNLWADLWPTWKTASIGMGGCVRTGIDWQQAESLMRLSGVKKRIRPRMVARLKTMQSEALKTLGELSEKSTRTKGAKHGKK